MDDCIFCKIIEGTIPSNKIYEDDLVYAFHDINKMAPVHFLVIPKQHISSTNDINADNSAIVAHIFEVIGMLAVREGIADKGYRVINNCGADGGQTVEHLHFHIMGGRALSWPAG